MPDLAPLCHVFAFEGRGGFPVWAVPGGETAPRRRLDALGNLLLERGRLGLSQVHNFWYDAVQAAFSPLPGHRAAVAGEGSGVRAAWRWRYYAQNHWRLAVAHALEVAAASQDTGQHGAIALLGFSNGGDAAYQTALALARQGVGVDLVITADPVRKPLRGLGVMGFRKPPNVARWHNFYQRLDRCSLGGWLPVVGRPVAGADTNRRLVPEDFADPFERARAHIWIPSLEMVRGTITAELGALVR